MATAALGMIAAGSVLGTGALSSVGAAAHFYFGAAGSTVATIAVGMVSAGLFQALLQVLLG
jgi:hypothetical protein